MVFLPLAAYTQTFPAEPFEVSAGNVRVVDSSAARVLSCKANRQQKFHRSMPPGNYSGITYMGDNRYALVSDKADEDGFYVFRIDIDSVSGKIKSVLNEGYRTAGMPNRDMEGIAWYPYGGTLFVSGEKDNEVLEYAVDGHRTGRRLAVPDVFATASRNYGLESLTYNAVTHRFWTTTESTLPADGRQTTAANRVRNRLRLQSFGDDLMPAEQCFYEMDESAARDNVRRYVMGVSELCALDDGRLLVLEREFYSSSRLGIPYAGALCKLYIVNPYDAPEAHGTVLRKTLVMEFGTKLNLLRRNIANYEGMCLGPKLADGSRVLILVSDSQNRYKGVLRDWFKTVVIR